MKLSRMIPLAIGLSAIALYGSQDPNLPVNPLYVAPSLQDFSKNPDLLKRIRSGPHGYFRFINIPFSQEICRRFRAVIANAPTVNLHGDAHLEQYGVTDLGRGLSDFDDASSGPAIIDWMRFGVSLHLACQAYGWQDRSDELLDVFLSGYRLALKDPTTVAPEPEVVRRLKSEFSFDRKKYFDWIASVTEAVPVSERDSLWQALQPYIENMLAENPDLTAPYFGIVDLDYLHLGIGSALDLKYLLRIHGKTDDPLDDVVLEIKQVRDLSPIDCIISGQKSDPLRILIGQARIAYQPFHHLGYFRLDGKNFWVQSWVDNYQEVKIGKSFASFDEVGQVAFDVGVQLGRGHIQYIAAPFDLQLRRDQLDQVNKNEKNLKQSCRELGELTTAAWQKFCDQLNKNE